MNMQAKKLLSRYCNKVLLLKNFLFSPVLTLRVLSAVNGKSVRSADEHITLAIEWLQLAQQQGSDNGYSRGYYFSKKWDKSYIETTGYIIPTLLEAGEALNKNEFINSALLAGRWLITQQLPSGAFPDIDKWNGQAFDTGQVLYGLNVLYQSPYVSEVEKNKYEKAIVRASNWLCVNLDEDSSWTTIGYKNLPHSYYSRVAFALAQSGELLKSDKYHQAARRHIDWVIKSQKENGYFNHLQMQKDIVPFLHQIIYVLEGLIEYYELTGYEPALKAALKNAEKFKEINQHEDFLLKAQYNEDFKSQNHEICVTGLAQWSGICFKIYKLTNDEEFLQCAKKSIQYLKSIQIETIDFLRGALPGSMPIWGAYSPFAFNNWPVKFFIDALLQARQYENDYISESKEWIGFCFQFHSGKVTPKFSSTTEFFYEFIKSQINKEDRILDLGCGEGKYTRRFSEDGFKNIRGADPIFYDNEEIFEGDCYQPPSTAYDFDCIFVIEAMQHVEYPNVALSKIADHLSDGGTLIIGDRDAMSIDNFLKPLKQFLGKWMYPYGSPFRENWYTTSKWQQLLEKNGFEILKVKKFTRKGQGLLGYFSRYQAIKAIKKQ